MSQSHDNNALAGALGSMIGYLGAEAAESSIFERLLWPQRFYAANNPAGMAKAALLMPMGGPLHKAALETLDKFRRKGIYGGMRYGHMLGTTFYPDSNMKLKLHGYEGLDHDNEVRNGLWVTVLQRLRHYQRHEDPQNQNLKERDEEKQGQIVRRTTQRVQHLSLSLIPDHSTRNDGGREIPTFSEDSVSLFAIITVVASEITAIGCALLVILAAEQKCFWFAGYFCLPLILKLISLALSVRRDPVFVSVSDSDTQILVSISDYDHGFPLISGPENLVRPFFRHWGHPIRTSRMDRVREIVSMALVVAFVFCFPIGLLSMLWVSPIVQMIWLAYQMYTIVVMHFNRLIGFEGPGRLEDCLAHALATTGVVRLKSQHAGVIEATLRSVSVARISEGQKVVDEIVRSHCQSQEFSKGSTLA